MKDIDNNESTVQVPPTAGKLQDDTIELNFPASSVQMPANLTEDDVANFFVTENLANVRFNPDTTRWLCWTGTHWQEDKTGQTYDSIRRLCSKRRCGAKVMASHSAINGTLKMAQNDQRIVVESNRWDANPMLLGTPNGTVNLVTGEIGPANPGDYITRLTKVAPAPAGTDCPRFDTFLSQVTGSDSNVQRFLLQFGGYALTGKTTEQALLFIYGPGGNGKSLFQTIISEILGEYAQVAAPDTFLATRNGRHPTELALLQGARLVTTSESNKDQSWSEARINQLTGGDVITARFMFRDNFSFKPAFKLLVVGNHKPKLPSVNDAARRRFNIVPFDFKPAKPDPGLLESLKGEYPAILRKLIAGCLDWQENGFVRPTAVLNATAEYFEEQDLVGRWIHESCLCGPNLKSSASEMFESWKAFAIQNGEFPGNSTSFGISLKNHGIQSKKSSKTFYVGITLKPE